VVGLCRYGGSTAFQIFRHNAESANRNFSGILTRSTTTTSHQVPNIPTPLQRPACSFHPETESCTLVLSRRLAVHTENSPSSSVHRMEQRELP
jgi:hypothetical protein